MSKFTKNILFIMYDQLRFDYLSYAGHKSLKTPNFDRVAKRGVNFTNTYVQSPVCGASRMSTYNLLNTLGPVDLHTPSPAREAFCRWRSDLRAAM